MLCMCSSYVILIIHLIVDMQSIVDLNLCEANKMFVHSTRPDGRAHGTFLLFIESCERKCSVIASFYDIRRLWWCK
jgi:hypothetical protein